VDLGSTAGNPDAAPRLNGGYLSGFDGRRPVLGVSEDVHAGDDHVTVAVHRLGHTNETAGIPLEKS
jgi:hypothetical protein